ncbi:MAG: periplasmic heavy metal sensor [Hyphomonadaceae bacterium]
MSETKRPVILLVSLAINLVLIGLVAGSLLNRSSDDRPAARHGTLAERPDVSPSVRRAVNNALRSARTGVPEARQRNEDARRALYGVLTADVFDPDAARTAFGVMRDAETAFQMETQESLIQAMSEMSAEERASIARRLTRQRGGPSRRR